MQFARLFPSIISKQASFRQLARPAVQTARALPAWGQVGRVRQGRGRLAVFLPAYGRHGAALLRIYNVARALKGHGWRTLVIPWKLTLDQRYRILARACPDVLVMQGARHDLNRPALYPGYSIIYDMDDADFHLPHLAGPVTRAMKEVACVIAGSRYIAEWCRKQGAEAHVVWTGTPVSGRPAPPQSARPPVVAWAQTRPETYEREAGFVLEVMRRVAAQYPDVRLRLYDRQTGDVSAFLRRFETAGIQTEWRSSAGYRDYLRSFDDVAVGLAPLSSENPFSRGKAFGKVLAYLDRRVPVVASDVGEYGAFFDGATGVVSNDMNVWVGEIVRLLGSPDRRERVVAKAREAFCQQLSVEASAERVNRVLRSVVMSPAESTAGQEPLARASA